MSSKTWRKKKVTITIAFVVLFILFIFIGLVKTYAQFSTIVSATIRPHYHITTDKNTLYVQTNMILYVNGSRIDY